MLAYAKMTVHADFYRVRLTIKFKLLLFE